MESSTFDETVPSKTPPTAAIVRASRPDHPRPEILANDEEAAWVASVQDHTYV